MRNSFNPSARPPVRYLSLYSGSAGGDVGLQHLLGWQCVGYVEWNKYCCRVIAQRIRDGLLSDAPVFDCDIREWIRLSYAASYTGLVDVVAAGFPCQPFSEAGVKAGEDDERNMWPATIDAICTIKPKCVFLENVPGIITGGYVLTVLDQLYASGYKALPPLRLSASDLGASHRRERIWIVAYADGCEQGRGEWAEREADQRNPDVARHGAQRAMAAAQNGIRAGDGERIAPQWWTAEPAICRVADGVADRMERLTALGNGQVPVCAAVAFQLLAGTVQGGDA